MRDRATLFEHIIAPDGEALSADLADMILKMGFPPDDHAKYQELSAKAQEGALSPDEAAELDEFLAANDFLMVLKSKARMSLRHKTPAA